MTHAWLITGPPGSGRSTAARAFAASLMCSEGGCGDCAECREVAAGSHPDVEVIRPEGVSYKTADARALVSRAAMAPSRGKWHVIVLEDADRLTETANNVLLKQSKNRRRVLSGCCAHPALRMFFRRFGHGAAT